jgi:hypothetical protein
VIAHHDVCFGCGQANLFGLQLELEETDGGVRGRFFVKQDHQGTTGLAHPGILACALVEAFSRLGEARKLEIEFLASAPVGTFVEVEVSSDLTAVARSGETVLARLAAA